MKASRVLFILFLISVFVIFFIPQTDVDFGWHYKCGQMLLSGNPCIENNFTYYLADYKWANPTFLYDGLLYITYNFSGFVGTSILFSALITFFAYVLYKSTKLNKTVFVLFFLASTYFSWNVFGFGLRSQILTLIFVGIFLTLITTRKLKTLGLLLVPLLFLTWANTHAGFFLGPLFLIIFVFTELASGIISTNKFKIVSYCNNKSFKQVAFLLFTTVVSIFITFINPFGYKIYLEVIHHSQTHLNMLIAEWTSPRPVVMLVMIVLFLLFLFLQVFNKKLLLFGSLILTFTLYLGLIANRNVPLFLFSYLIFLDGLKILPAKIDRLVSSYGRKFLIIAFSFLLICVAPFLIINTIKNSTYTSYCNNSDVKYPCKAIKFLQGKNVNIYNRYEWGGYLIWKLPQSKIYIDGRMPAWIDTENGKSPYKVWLDIYQTKNGWNEKLDKLKTDYLLISPYTFIDLELKKNPEKYKYKEVYRDKISVIYVRIKD